MKEPKGKQNWMKPKAWFNLGRPVMREILLWVKKELIFPDGYASNLKRGASLEKLKIFGLKSHDWYIWIEWVMPVMLRALQRKRHIHDILGRTNFFSVIVMTLL